MKQWHFYDKLYRRWVVLLIGSVDELKKELELNEYKYVEEIEDAKGMCIELKPSNNKANQKCTMVWLREYDSATLVHEITHLVMMCFEQVLVPISMDNTEAFAFYSEYWWSEINKVRRKYPNGRNSIDTKKATYV